MKDGMVLFEELFGRERKFAIKQGLPVSDLKSRYTPEPYEEPSIVYFNDGLTEVLCTEDEKVEFVQTAFWRFNQGNADFFGRPYCLQSRYGVGEICEFLFRNDIGFKYSSGVNANKDNCDLWTELGDLYYFRKDRVHYRLKEVTSTFF